MKIRVLFYGTVAIELSAVSPDSGKQFGESIRRPPLRATMRRDGVGRPRMLPWYGEARSPQPVSI